MLWKMLKQLLRRRHDNMPMLLYRIHDFVETDPNHWAGFDHGGNYDAHFTLRTNGIVKVGDEILVRMRSSRIARYHLYSVHRDFTGQADYKVEGAAVGYFESSPAWIPPAKPVPQLPSPKITALLGDGTWSTRPLDSELSDLSSSSAIPTSELWKVHARHEAGSRRPNPMR